MKKTKKRGKINLKKDNKRISTGISGLDKLIKGGFRKNSTNLVVGGTGSGKTILAMQFLIQGIKKNEACLFITFEEEKKAFYSNMKELGWDLESLEKKGKFYFMEYTPEKVKTMLDEGGGMIESLVLRKEIKRVVIDSITSFGLLFDDNLEKREAALSLFDLLRKWECTTILTYERDPSVNETNIKALEFESDSIILLYYIKEKTQRKRYLEILKMRGTEHSHKMHSLLIKKSGIFVR